MTIQSIHVEAETARILDELDDGKSIELSTLTIDRARALMDQNSAVWNAPLPAMADVRNLVIDRPEGPIPIRLLRPEQVESAGAIIYFHGGGFVQGSLDTHHRLMRLLAIESRATLIGVDYRLAPEHPFPAALEDCVTAVRWLREEAAALDLDPQRIALAGDSAGANLALTSLLKLRDNGDPLPAGAGLFYGCYWTRLGTESHHRFGSGGYRLSSRETGWFWNHYLGEVGKGDVLAEPMYADLTGLPPLFLNYAEIDPIADDTKELVNRLDRAGVVHECIPYPGLVHGFMQMSARVKPAAAAVAEAGRALREMLR